MTARIVDSKPQTQSSKIWNKPTARAQIGDYFHIPYTPVMQVVDKDELEFGHVWLLLKPTTASKAEEWVLQPEAKQLPAPQPGPQRQSTGFSGDSVGCQLRTLEVEAIEPAPTPEPETLPDVESQYERGRTHGQHDASQGWHPSYKKPRTDYARGYLAGYNAALNPTSPQVEVSKPVEWTVSFDKKWHWYWVWVGEHCMGQASTYQDAERMATERIAKDKRIFAQNEAVMKAYSAEKIATPSSSVRKKSEVAQKYSEEFEQMSTCGKLEIIQEILGHRQQALDDAAKKTGKVYLRAPAYSLCDEEGMDAFLRKVNNLERQYGSSSNQQKSLLASALINDEPVPNFPELASLSPRAKNNIALSLISVAATNIREKEQAEAEQLGIVKLNGASHPHVLKDDGLREKIGQTHLNELQNVILTSAL